MAQAKKKTQAQSTVPAVQHRGPGDGNLPDYLRKLKGNVRSNDNFDSTDVTIPRVKLIQALSKEIENYNEAKPGTFWHTGMDLPLGTEFDFVVVSRRKKYLLVAPLEDGQGILARSDDFINWTPSRGKFEVKMKGRKTPVVWELKPTVAESGLDKWGTFNPDDENSPPAATMFYEYLVLLLDHLDLGPVVLSLTRSQIKKAKKGLNDKIQMHESAGRPMQSLRFTARVVREESQQGTYFNIQFVSAGFVPEEIFKQAYDMKDVLATYKVRNEEEAARGEEETGEAKNPEDY